MRRTILALLVAFLAGAAFLFAVGGTLELLYRHGYLSGWVRAGRP